MWPLSVLNVAAAGVTGADGYVIPAWCFPSFRRKPESILGAKGMDPGE